MMQEVLMIRFLRSRIRVASAGFVLALSGCGSWGQVFSSANQPFGFSQ